MTNIQVISLYSGSTGNATLVRTPEGSFLIDAGKSSRTLVSEIKQAGGNPDDVSAVFVTHEHTDHVSAVEVFLKKHPIPVHVTSVSAEAMHSKLPREAVLHTPIYSETAAGVKVTSFPLSHDSAMCVGYLLERGGVRIGIATDTGYVTREMEEALTGCDAVIIECNHDVDMLRLGSYPPDLKCRILGRCGHLSNDDCAAFCLKLASSGTKNFMLAHISQENNRPDVALKAVRRALAEIPDARVCFAKPDASTVFVDI